MTILKDYVAKQRAINDQLMGKRDQMKGKAKEAIGKVKEKVLDAEIKIKEELEHHI